MSTCIWCKNPTHNEPQEHILPEGLVGEAQFTITGKNDILLILRDNEVCLDCNVKRLSPLDAYLQKQLSVFKVFLNRTGNKRGKPAKIEKPGIFAIHRSGGPHIHLNPQRKKIVTEDGVVIQPANDHPEAVRLTALNKTGPMVEANFQFSMRLNSKWFLRALHKIAFELVCFQQGVDFVADNRFDPIRDFVLRGQGSRAVFLSKSFQAGEWEKPGVTMHIIPGTNDWIAELRLGLVFFVDVTPDAAFPGDWDATGGEGFCASDKPVRNN